MLNVQISIEEIRLLKNFNRDLTEIKSLFFTLCTNSFIFFPANLVLRIDCYNLRTNQLLLNKQVLTIIRLKL